MHHVTESHYSGKGWFSQHKKIKVQIKLRISTFEEVFLKQTVNQTLIGW